MYYYRKYNTESIIYVFVIILLLGNDSLVCFWLPKFNFISFCRHGIRQEQDGWKMVLLWRQQCVVVNWGSDCGEATMLSILLKDMPAFVYDNKCFLSFCCCPIETGDWQLLICTLTQNCLLFFFLCRLKQPMCSFTNAEMQTRRPNPPPPHH